MLIRLLVLLYEDSQVAERRKRKAGTIAAEQSGPYERDKPPLPRPKWSTSSYDQEIPARNLPFSSSSYGAPSHQGNPSSSPLITSGYRQPTHTSYNTGASLITRVNPVFHRATEPPRHTHIPGLTLTHVPSLFASPPMERVNSGIRLDSGGGIDPHKGLPVPGVASSKTSTTQDQRSSSHQKGSSSPDSATREQKAKDADSLQPNAKLSDATYTKTWTLDASDAKSLLVQFLEPTTLRDAMVLYGSGQNARCGTCSDYLLFLTGAPSVVVDPFLDSFESALRLPVLAAKVRLQPYSNAWAQCTFRKDPYARMGSDTIVISLRTNAQRVCLTIDKLLIGIVAALRQPPGLFLAVSNAEMLDDKTDTRVLPTPLQDISVDGCWGPVFPKKIVAVAPVKHPFEMKGLELDFNLMTQLCGVDTPVSLDDGICLAGVYTILTPVRAVHDKGTAGCLQ
ncbi:uncharacterized protein A1O5_04620 [Cladophialophora psammophila CBS 110553]|uniref:Uncharacterized protein n=1 Tax=Cladophialophora psammophila CBS 110553 TaxID=1182543 RepID=W9X5B2_9EURO|nr:uncharacterized protein A1O5_04620 [Cladophialophora psammophila CBS 110553]EXJ72116.1 hypothetical protein A1O5_04620 [Cladophialophora psammophila CBS 110553]